MLEPQVGEIYAAPIHDGVHRRNNTSQETRRNMTTVKVETDMSRVAGLERVAFCLCRSRVRRLRICFVRFPLGGVNQASEYGKFGLFLKRLAEEIFFGLLAFFGLFLRSLANKNYFWPFLPVGYY